jgi:hypothetical protein
MQQVFGLPMIEVEEGNEWLRSPVNRIPSVGDTAPLPHQVTQVSKPQLTPAGVTQASLLATPTSSLVSPAPCPSATSMSPVPRQSDSSGRCLGCMAGGLPAGGLEGRAHLRKEGLSHPSSPSFPEAGMGGSCCGPAWHHSVPGPLSSACLLPFCPPHPTLLLPLPPKRAPGLQRGIPRSKDHVGPASRDRHIYSDWSAVLSPCRVAEPFC